MAVYSVSYDLNKIGQNYDGLINEIKTFNDYEKVMKSHWFIYYNGTAEQAYTKLYKHLDKNDHVLVLQASKDFRGWLSLKGCDWIQEHI